MKTSLTGRNFESSVILADIIVSTEALHCTGKQVIWWILIGKTISFHDPCFSSAFLLKKSELISLI